MTVEENIQKWHKSRGGKYPGIFQIILESHQERFGAGDRMPSFRKATTASFPSLWEEISFPIGYPVNGCKKGLLFKKLITLKTKVLIFKCLTRCDHLFIEEHGEQQVQALFQARSGCACIESSGKQNCLYISVIISFC